MSAEVSNHFFAGAINKFGLLLADFDNNYSVISKVLLSNSYFVMLLAISVLIANENSIHPLLNIESDFQKKIFGGASLDVEKYDKEEVEINFVQHAISILLKKNTKCLTEDLDSQFKDVKKNQSTLNGRFYINGVFAMKCACHGVPICLFDIEGGEG
ncbi:hypothetical protein BD560DRAFT_424028 [Blakeslea trispora]|nr:hypothetical protein BD560DRAFT_424028 [Blakeslea trispora]